MLWLWELSRYRFIVFSPGDINSMNPEPTIKESARLSPAFTMNIYNQHLIHQTVLLKAF
jgi:hypothetical protein